MSVEMQQTRFNSIERRPRTLKDFLSENHSSSCSSTGFKSLPRIKPNDAHKNSSMRNLIEMDLKSRKNPPNSAFQTLIKTIRSILVKKSATMILPRGISLKRSSTSTSSSRSRRIKRNQTFCRGGSEIEVSSVKIKDIIRWKSFGDINVEEHKNQSQPLDLPPQSPPLDYRCRVGSTTTTTTTTTTTCSSHGSSWSDSDFASGYLSSWEAQNDDVEGSEKFSLSPPILVGKDLKVPTTKTARAKGVSSFKEDEQHSPVSVLQVGEDEFSTFDQCLSNIERRKQKSIQSVQRLEGLAKFDQCFLLDENSNNYDDEEVLEEQDHVEERARQLLHCVKAATGSLQSCKDYDVDVLLLDFFREELIGRREQTWNDDEEYEFEILRIAKDWMIGSRACDIGHVNKDACIKDMDSRGGWNRFAEKEKQELALQIEMAIMHSLVGEVLDLDG